MAKKKKKINWESWNAIEEDLLVRLEIEEKDYLNKVIGPEVSEIEEGTSGSVSIPINVLSTPFGEYDPKSVFRPGKRWESWIGYTNFPVSDRIIRILNEDIEGIEALAILGGYTFCVGIAKMFSWQDVRRQIEKKLCK